MRNVSIQAKEAQGVMDLHSMNDSVMTNMEKPRYTLRRKEEKSGNDTPFFKVRTANTRLEDSIRIQKPRRLFDCFVVEGEVTVLFAPTNVGKSVLALQIADAISQGKSEYGF